MFSQTDKSWRYYSALNSWRDYRALNQSWSYQPTLVNRNWSYQPTLNGGRDQSVLNILERYTMKYTVGQGPTALAVGAGGSCLDIFLSHLSFSPSSLSLGDIPI